MKKTENALKENWVNPWEEKMDVNCPICESQFVITPSDLKLEPLSLGFEYICPHCHLRPTISKRQMTKTFKRAVERTIKK